MDYIKVDPDLYLIEEKAVQMINFLYRNSSKRPDRRNFDQAWVRGDMIDLCNSHGIEIDKIKVIIVDIAWNIERMIDSLSDLFGPNDISYYKLNKT